MTIQNILQKSSQLLKKTSTTPFLDTEVFLCDVLKKPKEFILANPEFELSELQEKKFWKIIERRKKFEPVAYILNRKEFFGLDFYIDKNVLIPRPETEMIVEMAINIAETENFQPLRINIIDVGTGSGCIIAAIAHMILKKKAPLFNHILPKKNRVSFFALDYSADSLKIARKNFKRLNLSAIKIMQGNLLDPFLGFRRDPSFRKAEFGMTKNTRKNSADKKNFDIIVSNLPYLNKEEYKNCPNEVKKYESKSALYGGKNGLKYIKKLILQAEKSELENCHLILEISPSQANYLKERGFEIRKDLFGTERFALKKIGIKNLNQSKI